MDSWELLDQHIDEGSQQHISSSSHVVNGYVHTLYTRRV